MFRNNAPKQFHGNGNRKFFKDLALTLVNTDILLCLADKSSDWTRWSIAQMNAASRHGPLIINELIYSELSVRHPELEDSGTFLEKTGLCIEPIPGSALTLAKRTIEQYRIAGGSRIDALPDIFIGAHAAIREHTVLTLDGDRYRTYFPTLKMITPESESSLGRRVCFQISNTI